MTSQFTRDALKPAAFAFGIAAVGGLAWLLFGDAIKRAFGSAGNLVNPLSEGNVAHRTVNAVGQAISGRESWALGSWLYDVFNEDANLASDRRARELLAERRSHQEQLDRDQRTASIGGLF